MRPILPMQRCVLVTLLALTVLVPALLVPAPADAGSADVRLGDAVVPTSQAIRLELDADQTDYTGSVSIELEVAEATDHFLLHSEGHEIRSLVLRGSGGNVEARHEKEADDVLAVRTVAPLEKGRYSLEIDFNATLGTRSVGLYRTEHGGAGYAFTQFEVNDARKAFPCWDEPRFKIPYQMTLTVPEAHLAVSNTGVEKETSADGWHSLHFKQTRPLPSYLLAIATGTFETVEMPGLSIPGRIFTVKGQSHLTGLALEMTPSILKALEDYFGTRHPYDKLDFIAVPEFWPGAMENAGAVTYADGILLVEPDNVTIGHRRTMAGVVAHELAHQWFGDLVTMEWWDDLWLNEAFADWMGEKIAHQVFPELELEISTVQSTQRILDTDARSTTEPIRKKVEAARDAMRGLGLTYVKGNAVLGMFEQWLGPEVFRRGINTYLKTHAWGNATASDLWAAFDQVSGKDVAEALATFIEQPGFARLEVELLDGGKVKLTQERFRNHGSSSADFTWQIPVTLKYPSGDETAIRTLLFDKASATIDLDLPDGVQRPEWIYPNAEARGYYRWNLAPGELEKLASKAGSVLSPRERIELLGNVASLLDAGVVKGGDYLEIVSRLATDPDLLVVRSVMGELGSVETAFVSPDLEDAFARYVKRTLGPVIERVGLERKDGEDEAATLVRPGLIGWLGERARDEGVREHAKAVARSYMKDPASVDPGLVGVALSLAAEDGDRELYDTYRKRFESAETPAERNRFLSILGAFGDPEIQDLALAYSLEGPLRPDEVFSIGFGMMGDEAGHDRVYEWFTQNYDAIMKRVPPLFASRMPFMANGCSMERLKKAQAFFSEPEHNAPGTAQQMARVAEQVKDCVALREREKEAVSRYLLNAR